MLRPTATLLIDGPVGPIQTLVDPPDDVRGLAVIAHPHPLLGGANNNKVVYTLAHTLRDLGHVALRPNFRGVGKSAGTHDFGQGETDDLVAVLDEAIRQWDPAEALPVVLAGFSFVAFVQAHVAKRLRDTGRATPRLVLVALAVGEVQGSRSYQPPPIPSNSILIHGDRDDVVPMTNVVSFAEANHLSVTVVPGADHFFHGRLNQIRAIVEAAWNGSKAAAVP